MRTLRNSWGATMRASRTRTGQVRIFISATIGAGFGNKAFRRSPGESANVLLMAIQIWWCLWKFKFRQFSRPDDNPNPTTEIQPPGDEREEFNSPPRKCQEATARLSELARKDPKLLAAAQEILPIARSIVASSGYLAAPRVAVSTVLDAVKVLNACDLHAVPGEQGCVAVDGCGRAICGGAACKGLLGTQLGFASPRAFVRGFK
jgi:hypothetical protein